MPIQNTIFLEEFLVCIDYFELFTKIKKGSGTSLQCHKFAFDHLKQWTLWEKGEEWNTKTWISRKWKELFSSREKHFLNV